MYETYNEAQLEIVKKFILSHHILVSQTTSQQIHSQHSQP